MVELCREGRECEVWTIYEIEIQLNMWNEWIKFVKGFTYSIIVLNEFHIIALFMSLCLCILIFNFLILLRVALFFVENCKLSKISHKKNQWFECGKYTNGNMIPMAFRKKKWFPLYNTKLKKKKTLHGLRNKMTQMSLWVDGMSILRIVPSQKQLITETAVGLLEELVENIGNINGNNCGKF